MKTKCLDCVFEKIDDNTVCSDIKAVLGPPTGRPYTGCLHVGFPFQPISGRNKDPYDKEWNFIFYPLKSQATCDSVDPSKIATKTDTVTTVLMCEVKE
jgi:hypothetical protein